MLFPRISLNLCSYNTLKLSPVLPAITITLLCVCANYVARIRTLEDVSYFIYTKATFRNYTVGHISKWQKSTFSFSRFFLFFSRLEIGLAAKVCSARGSGLLEGTSESESKSSQKMI